MADPTPAAQPGVTVDPYGAYNFTLSVQGVADAHFSACSGLSARVHPIRYREGGRGQVVRSVPGPVEYGEVTLWYGLTSSTELWNWFADGLKGRATRRHASIILLDRDGSTPVVRWELYDAWPTAWQGAPLDALSRDLAIESLSLVFESLARTT